MRKAYCNNSITAFFFFGWTLSNNSITAFPFFWLDSVDGDACRNDCRWTHFHKVLLCPPLQLCQRLEARCLNRYTTANNSRPSKSRPSLEFVLQRLCQGRLDQLCSQHCQQLAEHFFRQRLGLGCWLGRFYCVSRVLSSFFCFDSGCFIGIEPAATSPRTA